MSVGDTVPVRVKGGGYPHPVEAAGAGRYPVGYDRGGVNGRAGRNGIRGAATVIEP